MRLERSTYAALEKQVLKLLARNRGKRFRVSQLEFLLGCNTSLTQEALLQTLVAMSQDKKVHMLVSGGHILVWLPVDVADTDEVVAFLTGA